VKELEQLVDEERRQNQAAQKKMKDFLKTLDEERKKKDEALNRAAELQKKVNNLQKSYQATETLLLARDYENGSGGMPKDPQKAIELYQQRTDDFSSWEKQLAEQRKQAELAEKQRRADRERRRKELEERMKAEEEAMKREEEERERKRQERDKGLQDLLRQRREEATNYTEERKRSLLTSNLRRSKSKPTGADEDEDDD